MSLRLVKQPLPPIRYSELTEEEVNIITEWRALKKQMHELSSEEDIEEPYDIRLQVGNLLHRSFSFQEKMHFRPNLCLADNNFDPEDPPLSTAEMNIIRTWRDFIASIQPIQISIELGNGKFVLATKKL